MVNRIILKSVRYILLFALGMFLAGCGYRLKPAEETEKLSVEVMRYDRLQSRYLTTGDFSALQQMNMDYPMETRTLIEDVLKLGEVDDPEINSRFLKFYQDSILQSIIMDVESKYTDMGAENKMLNTAFKRLRRWIPDLKFPRIYTQIGALDQSIVIGNNTVGISLDKYLGEDYPLYHRYYDGKQRMSMNRSYIVPDCLSFYLLSLFPLPDREKRTEKGRDLHMGKIMWVVNKALDKDFFSTPYMEAVNVFMKKNPQLSIIDLLRLDDYSRM